MAKLLHNKILQIISENYDFVDATRTILDQSSMLLEIVYPVRLYL